MKKDANFAIILDIIEEVEYERSLLKLNANSSRG